MDGPSRTAAPQQAWYSLSDDDDGLPERLARQLGDAQVASLAAQRLDDFERLSHQHQENRKEQLLGTLSLVSIVLSVVPGLPATFSACTRSEGRGWDCAAQLSVMVGSLLAVGATVYGAYKLYTRPDHMAEELARLNDELERAMQAHNDGTVPVLCPLSQVRQMRAPLRSRFRDALHAHSRAQPDGIQTTMRAAAFARAAGPALTAPAGRDRAARP